MFTPPKSGLSKAASMCVATIGFTSYRESIPEALDALGAGEVLAKQTAILIKPNLVNASPPPVTTPAACCEAVVEYVKARSPAELMIGEGCGDSVLETDEVFDRLGYREMAARVGVPLLDLNYAPLRKLTNPDCPVFPEMYLPEIAFTHFIISVPVLKAHSLAVITGTLKNMPPVSSPN